ncbi:MAG TPA: MFS transporter [Solirubrobacteraceae bacterium]|nr:MFS transporter [Solirubrobacteraceae bacterium]
MSDRQRTLTLVVMCVGMFLVLLDVTIVNVALPSLRADLGAGVASLQWIVDGYAIAIAALMLPCGDFGDRHGHKRVVLGGLAAFGAGSLFAGLAPGPGVLVAARVVQGCGAALLLPGTLAVVSRAYERPAERARAFGIWAAISALALPAGVILGGLLVEGPGWRWAFLVNLPVIAVALPLAAVVVRETREPSGRALDAPGTVLGAALLGTATYALIERSWPAAAIAVALLAGFLWVERRSADPMLPIALFRRPAFAIATAAAATMNLGSNGTLFVLTLFLQDVQGRSPVGAGLVCLPAFATLALVASPAGRAVGRLGPRGPMCAGLLCSAAGLALLVAGPSIWAFVLWGAGLGFITPAVVAASMGAVQRDRAGLASALNNTARQVGNAIGIAAAGTIAGPPGSAGFVGRFHAVTLGAAALYVVVAALAMVGQSQRFAVSAGVAR